MRLLALAFFAPLLFALPTGAALCDDVEGVCLYDEERGDPECSATDSVGDRGTALYVDRADAHLGVSGYEGCGRGFRKDPNDPYTTYHERHILVYATRPGAGASIVWTEHHASTDGVETSGCSLGVQGYDGTPNAPAFMLDCPAPPPDAGWGRLLP